MNLDAKLVAVQLGRHPRGEWTVARRCACGSPQVIETHPRLDDGTPFPTTWWLSCKTFAAAVSRLESNGMIALVNERILGDEAFRRALELATKRYVERRDALEDLQSDAHPGGGPSRVKCLHAHVADQLVNGDNPVGSWVLAELGWDEPTDPCVDIAEVTKR